MTATVPNPKHTCYDHRYEPGAFGVCRRCGGEQPFITKQQAEERLRLVVEQPR